MSAGGIADCNYDGTAMLANCKSIELTERCKIIFNSMSGLSLRRMLLFAGVFGTVFAFELGDENSHSHIWGQGFSCI